MSLRELLDKFAHGFSAIGIFVKTSKELFPIVQENPNLFLALKRAHLLEEGVGEIEVNNETLGLLVDTLSKEIKIIKIVSKVFAFSAGERKIYTRHKFVTV